MCGIITGRVKDLKSKGGMKDHLRVIDHRGIDSFGMMAYSPQTKKWTTYKSLAAKQFIKKFNALSGDSYAIVHNRARSIGGVTLPLAHPIVTNEVGVIHNGTNKDVHKMIKGAGSDTEAISMLQGNAVDFTTTYNWLDDLGVVFTVDLDNPKADVHLHRDKIRPLVLHEETNIIASEPLFDGKWADIKVQDSYVPLHKNKITNMVISNDFVEVDIFNDEICSNCKKRHLHGKTSMICNVCLVRGEVYIAPKVIHTKTKQTYSENQREEAELLKQLQIVSGYVSLSDGSMMALVDFNQRTLEQRKLLIGYREVGNAVTANIKTYITEPSNSDYLKLYKGSKLYLLATNKDELESEDVFGYVTRGTDGTWYVVEDNAHDTESSTWYHVRFAKVNSHINIKTDGLAYSEDNFDEYLGRGIGNTILIDTTDTYVIDKDTVKMMGDLGEDENLLTTKDGDIIVPYDYKW